MLCWDGDKRKVSFDCVNFKKIIELTFIHHPIKIRLFRSSVVLSAQ
jgi:hypothetical protein